MGELEDLDITARRIRGHTRHGTAAERYEMAHTAPGADGNDVMGEAGPGRAWARATS